MKKGVVSILSLFTVLIVSSASGFEVPIRIFPLDNYDQVIEHLIKPSDLNYDEPLISKPKQEKMYQEFYKHYYSTSDYDPSPWNGKYVGKKLKEKIPLISEVNPIISNGNSVNLDITEEIYGENYQPYSKQWIDTIIMELNLKQFQNEDALKFNPNQRGIAIRNLLGRSLPTVDPVFYQPSLPGEGYPFDNIQESSVWIGTPLYIVGKSQNEQWSLVLTPHNIMVWVPSDSIAKTSEDFIKEWQRHAQKNMVAITRTNVSIFDDKKQYQFNSYVGTVFPGDNSYNNSNNIKIFIPVAFGSEREAKIISAQVSYEDASIMPLKATPHNFSIIMSTLLGRPYGWGNMYFYNDCSAELQNFYTPFGIWLPRQTSEQAKVGRLVDKSLEGTTERIKYLTEKGKKFTTIIYIGGHVMLYIGNYFGISFDPQKQVAMTYQNIWGLRPSNNSYRAVIGKSVLLPMLPSYLEDSNLASLANRKLFQIIYLDDDKVLEESKEDL